jgi:alpha-beta hydrolase superfamily lysophospholipase
MQRRDACCRAGRMMRRLIAFIGIALVSYIGIALALLAWPVPGEKTELGAAARELEQFAISAPRVQPNAPQLFMARDGVRRLFRLYEGGGPDLVVFLHGSSADSRYLARLARALSQTDGPSVATLDMRGHGSEPGRRGDVDAVGQQEEDIADLIATLRQKKSYRRVVLGGHSIGGGLAIRYAAGFEAPKPDALILLAPYVHRKSPSARADSGGWATPYLPRFAGVEMLQRLGIHAFDRWPVLRFHVPPHARDGTETAEYSWRLFASVTPRQNWRQEIRRIDRPVLVLAAERDVIFRSAGYPEIFTVQKNATVQIIPRIDHFTLSTSDEVPSRVLAWLRQF